MEMRRRGGLPWWHRGESRATSDEVGSRELRAGYALANLLDWRKKVTMDDETEIAAEISFMTSPTVFVRPSPPVWFGRREGWRATTVGQVYIRRWTVPTSQSVLVDHRAENKNSTGTPPRHSSTTPPQYGKDHRTHHRRQYRRGFRGGQAILRRRDAYAVPHPPRRAVARQGRSGGPEGQGGAGEWSGPWRGGGSGH
jgi:hypothetical protein